MPEENVVDVNLRVCVCQLTLVVCIVDVHCGSRREWEVRVARRMMMPAALCVASRPDGRIKTPKWFILLRTTRSLLKRGCNMPCIVTNISAPRDIRPNR